uniref:Uncharacterized protein n=1 Tax=Ixodes ricinus TaxID=34613 RepID=A0A6B0UNB0_IXORI
MLRHDGCVRVGPHSGLWVLVLCRVKMRARAVVPGVVCRTSSHVDALVGLLAMHATGARPLRTVGDASRSGARMERFSVLRRLLAVVVLLMVHLLGFCLLPLVLRHVVDHCSWGVGRAHR